MNASPWSDTTAAVALRLALDHADRVERLVIMDGVPICEALDRCDARFVQAWCHWFFYAQRDKPEQAINADPIRWYGGTPGAMGMDNHAEFTRAILNPDTVLAMFEDYRAGLAVDQHHERADRDAGIQVRCPTLVLWSSRDDMGELYGNPLVIWRDWATSVHAFAIESGHHMAEENPAALSRALTDFIPRNRLSHGHATGLSQEIEGTEGVDA